MIELKDVSKTVTSGKERLTILHPLDLHVLSGGMETKGTSPFRKW